MKSIFIGYFRPSEVEFTQLWEDSIFAIDANVLLNLYRYSPETREELEKALSKIKDKIFIPHQAAKEFLRNRLNVTAGQAKEYVAPIQSIESLSSALLSKNKHPFIPSDELQKFKLYFEELSSILKRQQQLLFDKLSNDEVLFFVENLFDGKTGIPFDEEELSKIAKEGEDRYKKELPPGYKDSKKDGNANDPYRIYGDLIVWKQIIKYAQTQNKSVIFITDDKKDDWWLEQSGKTISPRPEIIEEFYATTKQKFWMYTVEKFIQEAARVSKSTVSEEILDEIIKVSSDLTQYTNEGKPIKVIQEPGDSPIDEWQDGHLIVRLNRPMRYATGTGKFYPRFQTKPEFNIKLVDTPYSDSNMVGYTFGCGNVRDFNVHIKAKDGILKAGDYIFWYTASENFEPTSSLEVTEWNQ